MAYELFVDEKHISEILRNLFQATHPVNRVVRMQTTGLQSHDLIIFMLYFASSVLEEEINGLQFLSSCMVLLEPLECSRTIF